MGWGRLDDGWHQHPKLLTAGPLATCLQSRAISYCAHYETDGYLPEAVIPILLAGFEQYETTNGNLSPVPAVRFWPEYMIENGLWHRDATRPGYVYRVHDYLDWNRSHAWLEAMRVRARKLGQLGANIRWNKAEYRDPIADPIAALSHPIPSPKDEGSLTRVEKYNPLLSGQPREVTEGGDEVSTSPLHEKNLDTLTFEDFWTYYPIHTGIEAARRAWKRVTRKEPMVKRAIFSALAAQRHWEKKFWPNPARWLTEGRWQDEPARPLTAGPTALDTQVGLAKVRGLVTQLAENLEFKPPPGQTSAPGEGRSR